MLQAFLFAALLTAQEAKPAKTVEQRIQELTDRIAVLDKKATDLAAENNDLQRKLAVQEQTRDSVAKATATYWTKRHADALGLDDAKKATIEGLWISWTREDFGKPADPAAWKKREETLRKELSPEQAALVEKSVRADLDAAMDRAIGSYGKLAQIAAEREPLFRKTVWKHVKPAEACLIPRAHAGPHSALHSSLPDLTDLLSPEEHARLSKLLAK